MTKSTNPWEESNDLPAAKTPAAKETKATTPKTTAVDRVSTKNISQAPEDSEPLYDLEGLQTDFPTAKDLEKFVFDQTGYTLNLKGRSNKFKYKTAMDVLNGAKPDDFLLGSENPYLDKNDLIPIDPMATIPPRPAEVRDQQCVASFIAKDFEHPDPAFKAGNQKCEVVFRKYINNAITYEIIGPVTARAVGVRVNKFGKEVPEKYEWVDPRTGEQLIRDASGRMTPRGTVLKAKLSDARHRINKKPYWEVWVDREFIIGDVNGQLDNVWGS